MGEVETALAKRALLDGGGLKPLGFERVTGLSAVKGLTVPAGATIAYLQADTRNICWRDDGTNPSATTGMTLVAGNDPFLYTGDLSAIKFIEATATALLNITYY